MRIKNDTGKPITILNGNFANLQGWMESHRSTVSKYQVFHVEEVIWYNDPEKDGVSE